MNKQHSGSGNAIPNCSDRDQRAVLEHWEPVIGLEVHCQLKTRTKLFCGCSTRFGASPNAQTCPTCLGMPGALPVLNAAAVDQAIRIALAVGGELRPGSIFARKQYFYPDLPKGYQITQFENPYCVGGSIAVGSGRRIRLIRIHIEEDAGKTQHVAEASLVDLNRAGMPLVEIVSEPEIASPEEAADYLRRLRSLVRHIGVSDGNMEEGSFRCDANISLRRRGVTGLGTRCEIKNLNSFKHIEKAIWYEIVRQADILEQGGKVDQQTRLFDADSGRTEAMRSKEESPDYRYMPEPDLPPLILSEERVRALNSALPVLPEVLAKRFVTEHGLSDYDAGILTSDRDLSQFFDAVLVACQSKVNAKTVANWITGEFFRHANDKNWSFASPPISPLSFATLLTMIADGTVSGKIAKSVFETMIATGESPTEIVHRQGLVQVSDTAAISAIVEQVFSENPQQFQDLLDGKDKLRGFFIGQIMRVGKGKLNPSMVNRIVDEVLAKRRAP